MYHDSKMSSIWADLFYIEILHRKYDKNGDWKVYKLSQMST